MPPKRGAPEDIEDIRLRSRQDYLAKRQETQLLLLRKQVEEEAEEERRARDSGKALSKRELEDFQRNRKTLELATARLNIDDGLGGYVLPDADFSNKSEVLTRRGKETEYVSDLQVFESEQASKAKASQVRKPALEQQEDYEFVFDTNQNINFQVDPASRIDPGRAALQAQLDAAESKAKDIDAVRKSLPVYAYRDTILKAVAEYPVVVIVGETGSGKTTQIPQYLHEAGYSQGKNGKMMIGCTQPRRVAAMSVAARVAEEVGTRLGQEVGYSIRFDVRSGENTVLSYCTDGMLLREILIDPLLSKYSAIIVDEAHERTIATDTLMSLLKNLSIVRSDFKLLISSATLDAQKFSKYFSDAPILYFPGRMYPVETLYTQVPESNYLSAAVTTVFQVHISQVTPGDILVFLNGEDEITAAQQNIEDTARKLGSSIPELLVRPLYSQLDTAEQSKVFEPTPPNCRKVVLATNIAETSLTIDGICFVIDPGFSKMNQFSPQTGLSALVIEPCSRASANQRAGRAGRTGPGKAFRLYTRFSFHNELPETTVPEILRSELTPTILLLKAMGINNLLDFDFMDPPPAKTLESSLELLYSIKALDSNGALTRIGRQMSEMPLDPMLSASILAASNYGVVEEVLTIVAMLSESAALFLRPKDKKLYADAARKRFTSREGGDHLSLLRVYNEWEESDYSPIWCKENYLQQRTLSRSRDVREQLRALCDRIEVPPSSNPTDEISQRKAITAGYFRNVARLQRNGTTYRTLRTGIEVHIHPGSVLREQPPKWVVFFELVSTSKEYMRSVMPIDPSWLAEVAPHCYKMEDLEKMGVDKKMSKGQGKVGVDTR